MANPIRIIDSFAGQNWLITPAALAVNEQPPTTIHAQKWLLTLSGVAVVNVKGSSQQWDGSTLVLQPTVLDPMHFAVTTYGVPTPPGIEGSQYTLGFALEPGGAPFASLSSIFDQDESVNAGFAVDVWRPHHFDSGIDTFSHQPVGNLWTGLEVDVAVRDTDAWLFRVGYNIALLGKIVFLSAQETLFRSDFDPTEVGLPPDPNQAVGTCTVQPPPPERSVVVVDPPAPPQQKWLRIVRPNGPDQAVFQGNFSHAAGDGIYTFTTAVFLPSDSPVSSISFLTTTGPHQFLHIDFLPSNQLRVDDIGPVFGSFARDLPFTVQVVLNINASFSTVQVLLSGAASGQLNYTIGESAQSSGDKAAAQAHSRQFDAIQLWQGFEIQQAGPFDVTNIVVSRSD
jgi:hypothetical protein